MKKILINFVTLGRNGVDIPRLLKFKTLDSLGCELHLFSGTFIKRIKPAGKDVYTFNETIPEFGLLPHMKWTKTKFMLYALKMNVKGLFYIGRILRGNYDIIYSPSSTLDLVLIPFLVKLFSKKIKWVTVFDNIVPFSDPGNKLIRFLAGLFFQISLILIRKSDIIFVSTPELMEYLINQKFGQKKLVQSDFAIEADILKKAKADRKYNIDALFVGRINETKGIYDMLKVLELIKDKYLDFQLAIMGEGDEKTKARFKKEIKNLGLGNNVQFLGYKSGMEKYNIIKSAKCFWFLSISKSESFGIALLEAVCSGIPAFAYNLPQFSRLYPDGEVDISPKGDWELVAQKVIKLFQGGNFSNEKGKLLINKYSWEGVAEIEYEEIRKIVG